MKDIALIRALDVASNELKTARIAAAHDYIRRYGGHSRKPRFTRNFARNLAWHMSQDGSIGCVFVPALRRAIRSAVWIMFGSGTQAYICKYSKEPGAWSKHNNEGALELFSSEMCLCTSPITEEGYVRSQINFSTSYILMTAVSLPIAPNYGYGQMVSVSPKAMEVLGQYEQGHSLAMRTLLAEKRGVVSTARHQCTKDFNKFNSGMGTHPLAFYPTYVMEQVNSWMDAGIDIVQQCRVGDEQHIPVGDLGYCVDLATFRASFWWAVKKWSTVDKAWFNEQALLNPEKINEKLALMFVEEVATSLAVIGKEV